MKRIILLSIPGIFSIVLLLNLFHLKSGKNIPSHGINAQLITPGETGIEAEEQDGIAEAQKMDFELTKDVALGYVPKYRLVNAFENLMAKRKLSPNTPNSASSLSWVERGPNSDATGPSNGNTRAGNGITSGRMRAIWVDLSDPTNHIVWVGGVDGGIWKTTDISASPATWTPVNDFLANLAIGSICQDPTGSKNTMYFGTGEKTFNADAVRGAVFGKALTMGLPGTCYQIQPVFGMFLKFYVMLRAMCMWQQLGMRKAFNVLLMEEIHGRILLQQV